MPVQLWQPRRAVDDPAVGLGAKRPTGCCDLASGPAIRRAVDVLPTQAADTGGLDLRHKCRRPSRKGSGPVGGFDGNPGDVGVLEALRDGVDVTALARIHLPYIQADATDRI